MTRINANIKPSEMIDKHLMGEYFEIRRVRIYKPDPRIKSYRLGTGHVKFFATYKLTTLKRLDEISENLISRGLITSESYVATKQLFIDAWGTDIDQSTDYAYKAVETDAARLRLMKSLLKKVYAKKLTSKHSGQQLDLFQAISKLEFETENAISIRDKIINAKASNHPELLTYINTLLP